MNYLKLNQWFEQSNLGLYLARQEKDFFGTLTERYGLLGASVQFGMPDWHLLPVCSMMQVPDDVRMTPEAMAWADASLDLLILPHIPRMQRRTLSDIGRKLALLETRRSCIVKRV